ncbi:DNA-binding transcriptional regulator, MarR family [Proteiniborus ethanoligenes]|uniref:DNA-binding transcriptional regulator, MarR family n=1 Tax=Proteiniborus ethanoligenes TaxID=415015 RepID=A0A1H3KV26_9FIRM|nr:DNA-binding transcriptional regulator, MarR family [Proteiniborus ethanoligenes]
MFDLDACVGFITNRAGKKLANEFNERLLTVGITRVQWIALYYLGKHNELNQKELAELMDIKESSVARLIDRMEKEGYVLRKKDISDRRVTILLLTEKGIDYREKLMPEGEKMAQVFTEGISDEELEIFLRVIDKMLSNVK